MAGPPPRPPAVPVVGHALRWARDPLTVGSWANDQVGGVARIELFDSELVLVTDPEPIEEVLVEKRRSFPKSERYAVAFGEGWGPSPATSGGSSGTSPPSSSGRPASTPSPTGSSR